MMMMLLIATKLVKDCILFDKGPTFPLITEVFINCSTNSMSGHQLVLFMKLYNYCLFKRYSYILK